jgi:phosphoribosylanthranilate isomerase
MRIKICGLFRDQDIDYVNEAMPDYSGFVFAKSRRQVSTSQASRLRSRLADGIVPVGVFVDAPAAEIAVLYREGVISIAQLHGAENEEYISRLKEASARGGLAPIPVIKVIKAIDLKRGIPLTSTTDCVSALRCLRLDPPLTRLKNVDYYLIDSGAGSGKPFDWELLKPLKIENPWFLAGGVNLDNIEQAMALNPFALDISSGAETDGVKDREKIVQLTAIAKRGNIQ